ncbi:DUF3606 domain-containing protein [Mucilaginibacter mali]|uniref:DUF3606 domain-containing protein n=1 Tax=Mucilaginibacter mali TaxID=2740462 RepID=A0A7D4Q3I2_9SPHI|nr:DUF3606 domain-containing protein [Mucilaginibacter mali]QKJ30307.1 DUF3606 domain-containing protein [Mucilaginibacter mali]
MENKQEPPNAGKHTISLSDASEAAYWTEKFDTTKVRLKAAVNAVGPVAKDVEAYLKKK